MRARNAPLEAVAAAGMAVVMLAAPAHAAQARGAQRDTITVTKLDALIVSVERSATRLATSIGAVSLLTREELRLAPVRTLAEAVQRAPGAAFVDRDGLGNDPQLMMRGFYGGGEAEYALLLLDGVPLNHVESGRIGWDLIPLSAVESIEIVRGGVSSAWGDAAMGGVIHVRTRREAAAGGRASLSVGQHGAVRAAGSLAGASSDRPLLLLGNYTRTDGFRAHARRETGNVHASGALTGNADGMLHWSTTHDWRDYDEPGPLAASDLAASRTQSAPFYQFDHVAERSHRVGLDGRAVRGSMQLRGVLGFEYRHADRVRTLPLAPSFADTQARDLTSRRVSGTVQLEMEELPLPGDDRLMLGMDASVTWLASSYYAVLSGSPAAYAESGGTRGGLAQRGSGSRAVLAGFFGYDVAVTPAVRFSAGGRLDWLRDGFEGDAPDPSPHESTTHLAFSPRLGANVRVLATARQRGHVHAGVTRSFKAPTPDQLFDQRRVPVPFPPFQTGFANAGLEPQDGTSLEAGFVHQADVVPGTLSTGLTLSVYDMRLRDELDFRLETLRYENIGRSRHRGAELGLEIDGPAGVHAFGNWAWQSATAQSGENAGQRLKAIPVHWLVAGTRAGGASGLAASLNITRAMRMVLDDANTSELPDWTRWDASVSWATRRARVLATVTNLLDATYSTTGYPDPAGSGVVYWFPAAGRTFEIGLDLAW